MPNAACVLVFQEIFKIGGVGGNVIDQKVKHHSVALRDGPDILEIPKSRIHHVVPHGGEAPVGGGREKGKDVHGADHPVQVIPQNPAQLLQVFPQAVRVGDEHNGIVHKGYLPPSDRGVQPLSVLYNCSIASTA